MAKLDGVAERSPGLYRFRVGAFTMVGYFVYLLLFFSALGAVAGMGALMWLKPGYWILKIGWKLGIPLCMFAWVMVRALKITLPTPQGLPVTREQAPELFAIIDRISKQLAVPPLERVLLTSEYNAGVVQLPRLGIFGGSSYLMLGVPLMQALGKEDLTAVLAHEFGHLSGNHSRFSAWIYRSVRSYEQVLEAIGDNKLLHKFLNWYVPRLDAMSFPLRRQNEYEADAASAEIVGKERAARALTSVHVLGAFEDGFWTSVKRQVHTSRHPPAQLFLGWEKQLKNAPHNEMESALERALAERTTNTDTHPSLSDRLKKLGTEAKFDGPPELTAARALLGSSHDYLVEQAGLRWSAQVAEGWEQEHDRLVQVRERVAKLEAERSLRPLETEEAFEYANLFEDVRPDDDSLPHYQAVLALDREHLGARFAVGRLLLARDDAAGAELMQGLASHSEPVLRLHASALLARYYERRGEHARVAEHLSRARDAHQTELDRERRREQITTKDQFAPHDLDAETLSALQRDLALFPAIKHAYVVKKLVDDEFVGYLVALDVTFRQAMFEDEGLIQRVADTVSLPAPNTWCIRLDKNDKFRKPLEKIPDSRVTPARA